MTRKLYIETHGCQMNEYDSSRMVDLLGEHQALEVTARAEDADVILLNTCSIRERAQDRVYSQLGRWRERSEEHTSELQSLMRISYAVFCLKKKNHISITNINT